MAQVQGQAPHVAVVEELSFFLGSTLGLSPSNLRLKAGLSPRHLLLRDRRISTIVSPEVQSLNAKNMGVGSGDTFELGCVGTINRKEFRS